MALRAHGLARLRARERALELAGGGRDPIGARPGRAPRATPRRRRWLVVVTPRVSARARAGRRRAGAAVCVLAAATATAAKHAHAVLVAPEPGSQGEHDDVLRTSDLSDQGVEAPSGACRSPATGRVAIEDGDQRYPGCAADASEHWDVRPATAGDDRDPLAIRVVSERVEYKRQGELLRLPLDQRRCAGEEELAALRVELAEDAEILCVEPQPVQAPSCSKRRLALRTGTRASRGAPDALLLRTTDEASAPRRARRSLTPWPGAVWGAGAWTSVRRPTRERWSRSQRRLLSGECRSCRGHPNWHRAPRT
jgi:hypothetical protein